ncbi:predicted protein [Nematostella vectensis]|uniref:Pentraxin (PTX) domain-containing protein n=1 Tax=Nematostella vectensis TaxID=45351 RepID=A7SCH3_NEMVE|nr:predicted protein [Nematostella vectensis]|eukprot:XP_001630664.1 predicted protein [Nematostella vectensis]
MHITDEQPGKELTNHVEANFTGVTEVLCRIKCFISDTCQSYNYDNSSMTCQTSTSTRVQSPDDVINKTNSIYAGFKNPCDNGGCPRDTKCKPNFETDLFTCVDITSTTTTTPTTVKSSAETTPPATTAETTPATTAETTPATTAETTPATTAETTPATTAETTPATTAETTPATTAETTPATTAETTPATTAETTPATTAETTPATTAETTPATTAETTPATTAETTPATTAETTPATTAETTPATTAETTPATTAETTPATTAETTPATTAETTPATTAETTPATTAEITPATTAETTPATTTAAVPGCVLHFKTKSTSNYIQLIDPFATEISSFTISVWLKVSDDNIDSLQIFSYATSVRIDDFFLAVKKNGHAEIKCGGDHKNVDSDFIRDNTWQHLLITTPNGRVEVYKNKVLIKGHNKAFRKAGSSGTFILGQHQGEIGGAFDSNQLFYDYMANLNIWEQTVGVGKIDDIYSQGCQGLGLPGPVLSWENIISQNIKGDIEKKCDMPCPDFNQYTPGTVQ